jgi:hypothetical protein
MNYFQRLTYKIIAFALFILAQEVGLYLRLLIFNRGPEQSSLFYLLFLQPDTTSKLINLLSILLIFGVSAYISPFIERFLRKHGYLPRKI